jgi:hypothetical protein
VKAVVAKRSNGVVKIAVVVAVLAGLGYLFMNSVRSTRAEPYTVARMRLAHWTPAIATASDPTDPMLVLEAPPELASDLFRQIFARAMESLNAPSVAAVPLLLRDEFDRAFAGRITPDALLAAARNAGLGSTPFEPRCLAYRRVSEPGATRQLYFVLFDAPAFGRFREEIGALLDSSARGSFDAAALSPVLLIAGAGQTFSRWLPLRADPQKDCIAPIAAE